MTESNITKFQAKPVAAALPNVTSTKMVAVIAADLPPALREGTDIKQWLNETQSFIGSHPEIVLREARDSILSTYQFAPKKSEIIQHILDAYQRLGVALSEDAKRHLSFRKKMPVRYTLNDNGVKRFADDAKVTLVGYFTMQGPQANIILDSLNKAGVEAIVDDIEKAIEPVQAWFKNTEGKRVEKDRGRVTGGEVLERFKFFTKMQCAYRISGEPAAHCGGPVAHLAGDGRLIPMTSTWLAMSEAFVDRMRDTYPFARVRNNPTSWGEAMKQAFWATVASRDLDESRYGAGLQRDAEAMIEARMADLNREGRIELKRALAVDKREAITNLSAITVAETALKGGQTSVARITVNGESMMLDSLDACAIARRKVETMASKVDAEMDRVKE